MVSKLETGKALTSLMDMNVKYYVSGVMQEQWMELRHNPEYVKYVARLEKREAELKGVEQHKARERERSRSAGSGSPLLAMAMGMTGGDERLSPTSKAKRTRHRARKKKERVNSLNKRRSLSCSDTGPLNATPSSPPQTPETDHTEDETPPPKWLKKRIRTPGDKGNRNDKPAVAVQERVGNMDAGAGAGADEEMEEPGSEATDAVFEIGTSKDLRIRMEVCSIVWQTLGRAECSTVKYAESQLSLHALLPCVLCCRCGG